MAESPSPETIAHMHRWFAIECNNTCWELIEKANRSPEDDRLMLYRAYGSAYHWDFAGTPLNAARAELTLAHAHSLLGQGELALIYARRDLDFCEHNDCEDWDLAFAHAAMAFAAAVNGDAELHARHYAEAKRRGEVIADEIDRSIFQGSFNQIPSEVLPHQS